MLWAYAKLRAGGVHGEIFKGGKNSDLAMCQKKNPTETTVFENMFFLPTFFWYLVFLTAISKKLVPTSSRRAF